MTTSPNTQMQPVVMATAGLTSSDNSAIITPHLTPRQAPSSSLSYTSAPNPHRSSGMTNANLSESFSAPELLPQGYTSPRTMATSGQPSVMSPQHAMTSSPQMHAPAASSQPGLPAQSFDLPQGVQTLQHVPQQQQHQQHHQQQHSISPHHTQQLSPQPQFVHQLQTSPGQQAMTSQANPHSPLYPAQLSSSFSTSPQGTTIGNRPQLAGTVPAQSDFMPASGGDADLAGGSRQPNIGVATAGAASVSTVHSSNFQPHPPSTPKPSNTRKSPPSAFVTQDHQYAGHVPATNIDARLGNNPVGATPAASTAASAEQIQAEEKKRKLLAALSGVDAPADSSRSIQTAQQTSGSLANPSPGPSAEQAKKDKLLAALQGVDQQQASTAGMSSQSADQQPPANATATPGQGANQGLVAAQPSSKHLMEAELRRMVQEQQSAVSMKGMERTSTNTSINGSRQSSTHSLNRRPSWSQNIENLHAGIPSVIGAAKPTEGRVTSATSTLANKDTSCESTVEEHIDSSKVRDKPPPAPVRRRRSSREPSSYFTNRLSENATDQTTTTTTTTTGSDFGPFRQPDGEDTDQASPRRPFLPARHERGRNTAAVADTTDDEAYSHQQSVPRRQLRNQPKAGGGFQLGGIARRSGPSNRTSGGIQPAKAWNGGGTSFEEDDDIEEITLA